MTFNHSAFITDALNGFSMQETDFPYISVIIDDASTDGNQRVILDYVQKYFNTEEEGVSWTKEDGYACYYFARHKDNLNCYFAVLLLKNNQFGKSSKAEHIKEWEKDAQYVAICEGDDYWIDKSKLFRQVRLMDEHPEYSMCTENGYWLDVRDNEMSPFSSNPEKDIDFEELLVRRQFPTASVIYRNCFSSDILRLHEPVLDTSVWACLSKLGIIHYQPIISSVYRRGFGITEKDKIKWAYTVRRFNKSLYQDFVIPDGIKALRDKDVAQNLKKGLKDAEQRRRYSDMFRLGIYYIITKAKNLIRHFSIH
jgi:hypothetical protein